MAVIAPFRGILYNQEKVGEMSKVIAPPYDVISPEGHEKLYQNSPYNVVRIDFGKSSQTDSDTENKYTRSAAEFKRWLAEGVMAKDAGPSIYVYEQDYRTKDGSIRTRKGFMSLVRLEELDSGVILPHERTLSGPKTDRLNLTRACGANFSPIFSLYSDPEMKTNRIIGSVSSSKPLIQATDPDGVVHRLWRYDDAAGIERLVAEMADKSIFIADGHHRYETALNYRNEMREKNAGYTGKEGYNYTLMYFSNMDDKGLTVFPTHRLIYGVSGFSGEMLEDGLKGNFDIERHPVPATEKDMAGFVAKVAKKGENAHALGVYASGWDHAAVITLRDEKIMDELVQDHSPAYRRLDVTVLHTLIVEKVLGISRAAQERKENIEYIQDEFQGLLKVKGGDRQALFILNPTKVTQVEDIARAGDKMPQKSTYFYPKLLTGLVINDITT